MVIFRMGLEVLSEIFDALTQQRNLHFRGAGIALMKSELLYYPFFLLLSNPHDLRFVSLSFFTGEISSTVTLECKVTDDTNDAWPCSMQDNRIPTRSFLFRLFVLNCSRK
jgi:hypothetical protein